MLTFLPLLQREATLHNSIKGDKNLFLKANWESKTDKLIKNRIVKNRIEDMEKRRASDLNARKARLAEVLAAEDEQYEREFMENLETPEQVRA